MSAPAKVARGLVAACVLGGCGPPGVRGRPSAPTSLLGSLDLSLVRATEWTHDRLARATGGLAVKLPGTPLVVVCSAVRIGATRILTASHCRSNHLVFLPRYLAREGGALTVDTSGAAVRVDYDGGPGEPRGALPVRQPPLLLDETLDYAVYELEAQGGSPQQDDGLVSLDEAGGATDHLALYGYPNGVPLTRSAECAGISRGPTTLMHDCDSLPGSSGGLLVDQASGRPVALHLAGAAYNESAFYEAHGTFETPQDFAARFGCTADEVPDAGALADCIVDDGYNRALPLAAVAASIKQRRHYARNENDSPVSRPRHGGTDRSHDGPRR